MAGVKGRSGGAREHSGPKRSPLVDLKIGAASSERLLAELEHEKQTKIIYRRCGDWRLKWQILEDLRDRAFGKPAQPIRHTGPNDDEPMRMIMEDVGSQD